MWIFPNCLSHHGLVLTFSEPAWDWDGTWTRNHTRNLHRAWLRGDKLSLLHPMMNHGDGGHRFDQSQTYSQPLPESGCFLPNRSQHRLGIARMLNKDQSWKSFWSSFELNIMSPWISLQVTCTFTSSIPVSIRAWKKMFYSTEFDFCSFFLPTQPDKPKSAKWH